MGWYDTFASFYDVSLEKLYAPFRAHAAQRLALAPGQQVLDAGCGTGQSFEVLCPAVGDSGRIVGVDFSAGMLAAARRRAERRGFGSARLVQGSLLELDRNAVAEHLPDGRGFDRALCFLVLSALPDYEAVTWRVWELLEPGGTMVIVDTHAEKLGLQGRLVNLTARADIRRPVWSALEAIAEGYQFERLAAPTKVGGDIIVATGRKPRR